MKLLHAADVHLDSPLRGLERYPGAPAERIRGATRRALEGLVRLAQDEEVSLVLLAGDLYDGGWRDYNTGLFFNSQMSRLREAGIRVVVAAGNHDAASRITRYLRPPDNVVFLSTARAETVAFEDLGVAVHGRGYPTRQVTEDLSAGYPDSLPGLLNVGLLHTSLDGRPGHERYAPCSLAALVGRGYDYWALGHVHAREVLHRDPWIVFSGNLQGRHVRETGAKGCTLVEVEDGAICGVEHRAVDVLRWACCELDAAEVVGGGDVVAMARAALAEVMEEAEGRPVAARLVVRGETRAHAALAAAPDRWRSELRAAATDLGEVWLEQVRLATAPPVLPGLGTADALGALLDGVRALEGDLATLRQLAAGVDELQRRLPPELREGEEPVELLSDDNLRAALADVRGLLVARLGGASS